MFEVKDKNNATLFMHDKIKHVRLSDHGETISTDGIICVFIDESTLQYQPEGKGLPTICPSNEVVQVDSLAQRAMSLKTDEDFQTLIKDATERYLAAVADGKKTKTSGGRKKAKPKVEIAQNVLDALAGMKKK
jgi:hypothetical protein